MQILATAISCMAIAITTPIVAADTSQVDIVVYSGVPCGIAAAITAAREGQNVVLIEPTRHVGGLSKAKQHNPSHQRQWHTAKQFAPRDPAYQSRHDPVRALQLHDARNTQPKLMVIALPAFLV